MSVNPYAPTDHPYTGPDRRTHPDGCPLAHEVHGMLVGDRKQPGVFEELRGLHVLVAEVRTLARWVVLFAGVIAACTAWSALSQ